MLERKKALACGKSECELGSRINFSHLYIFPVRKSADGSVTFHPMTLPRTTLSQSTNRSTLRSVKSKITQ